MSDEDAQKLGEGQLENAILRLELDTLWRAIERRAGTVAERRGFHRAVLKEMARRLERIGGDFHEAGRLSHAALLKRMSEAYRRRL